MKEAKFERQRFGAMVATIVETAHVTLEVLARNDGRFVLTVHNRTGEADRWEDLSVTLEPQHFEMLGSIAGQRPMSEKCSDISAILRRFHRNSCYPEATDFEVAAAASAIAAVQSDIFGPNVGPPTEKPIKGIDVEEGGF